MLYVEYPEETKTNIKFPSVGEDVYDPAPKSKTPAMGWQCPRCGRINAPWVRVCVCGPHKGWDKPTITWC